MMAPTVVLRDGEPEIALGSAGSNRIRSAIVQTIVGVVDAGSAPRRRSTRRACTWRATCVDAEPGVRPEALARLEARGWTVRRWEERNLYFGGVQAVARDPASGELSGGGDPRRGGVVVTAG